MTARFAGSRSVDERRRRRLATEADDAPDHTARSKSAATRDAARVGSVEALPAPRFPLRKIVSPRRWKLWTIAALALAVGGSISGGPLLLERFGNGLPEPARPLVSTALPRIAVVYSVTLLVLSAQLGVVVWWARSKSKRDFDGRYRIWPWTVLTLLIWAFCLMTGAHVAAGELGARLWRLEGERSALLAWLIPAAVWLLLELRVVLQETRECRPAVALVWLAGVSLLGAGGLEFAPSTVWLPATVAAQLQDSLPLLAQWSLFAALLLFARHVLYVTPEPAALRAAHWRRVIRRIRLPRIAWRWNRRNTESTTTDDETETAPKPAASKSKRTSSLTRPKQQTSRESVVQRPEPGSAFDSAAASDSGPAIADQSRSSEAAPPPTSPAVDDADFDADNFDPSEGPEQDALKGLSKRERRKLRKQWRDQQRRGNAA